mmetsp:Transcript_16610/g.19901  ORF Transcript_16610/g.19901 Transcript_16610/m.19901 type:complete len:264 (+) Transcript_16610:407-1198(+)
MQRDLVESVNKFGSKWAINAEKWKPDKEEFEFYVNQVQPDEQARIKKFRFEIDRKRALCGRLLIRHLVSLLFSIPSGEVKLGRTEKKKPILLSPQLPRDRGELFEFNISHHGEWVVLVWSHTSVVGVDVMDYSKPRGSKSVESFFDTMKSSFTDDEWLTIKAEDEEEKRLKEFYRHWSLKESYIKAIGLGLGFELRRGSFFYPDAKSKLYAQVKIDGVLDHDWHFVLTELDDNHCVSTATRDKPNTDSWRFLELDGKTLDFAK